MECKSSLHALRRMGVTFAPHHFVVGRSRFPCVVRLPSRRTVCGSSGSFVHDASSASVCSGLWPGWPSAQSFQGGLRGAVQGRAGRDSRRHGHADQRSQRRRRATRSRTRRASIRSRRSIRRPTRSRPRCRASRPSSGAASASARSSSSRSTSRSKSAPWRRSITVTADAPLIETSNASHAEVLDAKTLETLPSVGRNVFLMAVTVPTVQSSGDTHWNRMQDQTGASAISIGGGGVRAEQLPARRLPGHRPAESLVDQPERRNGRGHPRAGAHLRRRDGPHRRRRVQHHGQVGQRTQFRGSAFYPEPSERADRPAVLQPDSRHRELADSSGAAAGGGVRRPVIKNKTFFWVAGEGYRDGLAQNDNLHVPTAAMRNGDFSNFRDAQGQP